MIDGCMLYKNDIPKAELFEKWKRRNISPNILFAVFGCFLYLIIALFCKVKLAVCHCQLLRGDGIFHQVVCSVGHLHLLSRPTTYTGWLVTSTYSDASQGNYILI